MVQRKTEDIREGLDAESQALLANEKQRVEREFNDLRSELETARADALTARTTLESEKAAHAQEMASTADRVKMELQDELAQQRRAFEGEMAEIRVLAEKEIDDFRRSAIKEIDQQKRMGMDQAARDLEAKSNENQLAAQNAVATLEAELSEIKRVCFFRP